MSCALPRLRCCSEQSSERTQSHPARNKKQLHSDMLKVLAMQNRAHRHVHKSSQFDVIILCFAISSIRWKAHVGRIV